MPPRVNREMVLSRIGDIQDQLGALRAHAALPDRAFLDDPKEIRSARYALIVLVEAAAAICGHLSARLLKQPVDAYPECFENLASHGLLDPGLAKRMSALARLRNIVVHGYGRVDDARFLRMLREDLGDVDAYLEAVRRWMAQGASS